MDVCPVISFVVDIDNELLPVRPAPLPVWRSVATLLELVRPQHSLRLQGLGLPADAAPGTFTCAGRAITAAAEGFTGLEELRLHMSCQGVSRGQPFEVRLGGAFPQLTNLILENTNDGLDGEVMLTLGHMPRLEFLNVTNAGAGGWVVPTEPLPRLEALYLVNSCPRFANAEAGFPGVHLLCLVT